MAHGQVPYRDFALEYPPGALPAFVVPRSLRSDDGDLDGYRRGFEAQMLALRRARPRAHALDPAAGRRRPGGSRARSRSPRSRRSLLGSVVLSRFDLWPALADRRRAGGARRRAQPARRGGARRCAVAAKIYPAVLVPLVVVWVWRRRGRREALVCLGIFGGVLAAVFLPFLVLSPHGRLAQPDGADEPAAADRDPRRRRSCSWLHTASGLGITMESSHGSQNLAGRRRDALAVVQTVARRRRRCSRVWVGFARGPGRRASGSSRASAAAVCAFIAFGKVLSPQFLIWLVPLVPLVRGRRGLAARPAARRSRSSLTQLWFPFRYWDLVLHFATFPSLAGARPRPRCSSRSFAVLVCGRQTSSA